VSLKGLVDREHELEALRALVDAATAGRGGFVLVEGPAGIGKTRLLAATREVVEERGLQVLSACGSELERDFPFGAVRQLLEPPLAALAESERAALFEGGAAHALALFSQADARPAADPDFATLYSEPVTGTCGGRSARRKRTLRLGNRAFSAQAGRRVMVRFRLSRAGLTRLKAAKRVRMRGIVVVRDAVGNATTARFRFTLEAPRPKRRRG
jgi:AAA ATPase domain